MKVFSIIVFAAFLGSAGAQSVQPIPGTVLVQIAPEAIPQVRSLFAKEARGLDAGRINAGDIVVRDERAIEQALGVAPGLHLSSIRPYIANHSIAFEALRVRMNPQVFGEQQSPGGAKSDVTQLRQAEERVSRWFILEYTSTASPLLTAKLLRKSSLIVRAEARYPREAMFQTNDPLAPQQWGLAATRVFEAWDHVRCDSTMVVADVDIGTMPDHPDLIQAIHINYGEMGVDSRGEDKNSNGVDDDGNGFVDDWRGWDFASYFETSQDNNPTTSDDHGTHTAGIIAATGNNNEGIVGIAFGAKLIPLKTGRDRLTSSDPTIDFGYQAIAYAADMGSKVINCSWGGHNHSQAEQDVINYAFNKDAAVVAAAGNDGVFQEIFPAAYDHVLSVTLSASNNTVGHGDFNRRVDVVAPGVEILSTVYSDTISKRWYGNLGGTSMAAPHATGAVALIRQRFPAMTAGQAMEQLRVTTDSIDASGKEGFVGSGKIDILRAVTETNTFSARIEDAELVADLGPNKRAGAVITVTNYLSPLEDLRATVEIVEGGDHVKLATAPELPLGAFQTLQTNSTVQAGLQLEADSAIEPNTIIVLKFNLSDAKSGYRDVDYATFIANPDYKDLTANNLRVTITSNGAVGYNDPGTNHQGTGFVWQTPPPTVSTKNKSTLFEGGLMIGIDSTRVVSVVEGADPNSVDHDFASRMHLTEVEIPENNHWALQELRTVLTDSAADPIREIGLVVDHRAYAAPGNAEVFEYVVRKRPTTSGAEINDKAALGLYMDWDLGIGGGSNEGYVKSNVAICRRIDSAYPYAGMKVIALPTDADRQIYLADNNGSGDSFVNLYDTFPTEAKWRTLNYEKSYAGVGDVSQIVGVKHLRLLTSDSILVAYAIALGESESDLLATIQRTENLYLNKSGVALTTQTNLVSAYPNPFSSNVSINWHSSSEDKLKSANVSIVDELGRSVYWAKVTGERVEIKNLDLTPGIYLVTITQGSTQLHQNIVKSE